MSLLPLAQPWLENCRLYRERGHIRKSVARAKHVRLFKVIEPADRRCKLPEFRGRTSTADLFYLAENMVIA